MAGRIIGTRLPCCPGKDSRFTIKHNSEEPGNPWWVFYNPPGDNPMPADDPHKELVQLVNSMKLEIAHSEGGAFSINEHGQVIARAKDTTGVGNTVHIVNVTNRGVSKYSEPLLFANGTLDPMVLPDEGEVWPGPLSGMTYSFAAPGNAQVPSRNVDEIFVKEEGELLQISTHAHISPYPPIHGPLTDFLTALRRRFPQGGRFRVNEHGRAFTSNGNIYIDLIPLNSWFKPLTARS